jgi:RHS repeat-associated protein
MANVWQMGKKVWGAIFCMGYGYFLDDHLGSTRMVLAENGQVKEALMYQPYGTVSDVAAMGATATDPLRQKFTTKEFDEEGDANFAPGIKAYHFGFRVYDPDLGIWMSTDPKDQFWSGYGYTTNPIMFVDPDGSFIIGTLLAIAGIGIGTAAAVAVPTLSVAANTAGVAAMSALSLTGPMGTTALATGIGAAGIAATTAISAGALGVSLAAGAASSATRICLNALALGQAVNDISYTYRMATGQGGSAGGTFMDYLTGGNVIGGLGNTLGLLNLTAGGSMDWYDGYTVYSGGVVQGIADAAEKAGSDFSGSEYFGPALFVTDRNNKSTIAHEIHHMRQMNAYGNRLGYIYDYAVRHNTYGTMGDYYSNPYEIEASFYGWAQGKGYVDIYGNWRVDPLTKVYEFRLLYDKDLNPVTPTHPHGSKWDVPDAWQPTLY